MSRKTVANMGADFITKFVGGLGSTAGRGIGKNITSKPSKKFELGKAKLMTSIGGDFVAFFFDDNDWKSFQKNMDNLSKYAGKFVLIGAGTVTTFIFVPPIAAATTFCWFGAAAAGATYTAINVAVPIFGAGILVSECSKVGKDESNDYGTKNEE